MRKPVFAAIAVGVLSVTMLVGWRSYGGGPMDPQKVSRLVGARVENVLDDVDATDQQRTQVKAVSDRLVKEGLELRKGTTDSRKEIFSQLSSNAPDRTRLHGLVDQRAEEFKAFAHKAVDAVLEVHGILTPQQRATLAEKVKDRMGE